jgi:hypothetical protein
MKIARQWGREPNWFFTLSKPEQVRLMALWRIENTPEKERKKRSKAEKEALLKRKIREYSQRDQIRMTRQ